MSYLRTISTRRILGLCAAVVIAAGALAAIALAAGGSGPKPAPKPLAQALRDALNAPPSKGVTARIAFTNRLIDSGVLQGSDPILTGATGRLWAAGGRLRLELQASPDRGGGDVQVLVDGDRLSVYDSGSNTVYRAALPRERKSAPAGAVPSLARIQKALDRLMTRATLSAATPSNVAGRPAYTVRGAPRDRGALLDRLELAWDAGAGVPLRAAVYGSGSAAPVLELKATKISFGSVPASNLTVAIPSGAKTVDLAPGSGERSRRQPAVTGLAEVRAKLSFALAAPARLAGRARGEVRLVELDGTPGALVSYGKGPGALAVLETRAGPQTAGERSGLKLPQVAVNGGTGEELDTALGTVVRFRRAQVEYTVVGSVRPPVAKAAARAL